MLGRVKTPRSQRRIRARGQESPGRIRLAQRGIQVRESQAADEIVGLWAGAKLVGLSGAAPGYGKLLSREA